MKTQHTLILLFSAFFFLNLKCKKENNEPQLPPETTTGAMTFGCKIDGKVFVPKGTIADPELVAHYYFLGNGAGGGWFLFITASNVVDNPHRTVLLETDSLLLTEGSSYTFKKMKGFSNAKYASGLIDYEMTTSDTGYLLITKHDQSQHMLSGRFSFTATNQNGEKVNITDGRFDIRY